ncbi:MAG: peptidylprolyl isomerase [Gammaproteobacteria bacterium]
MKSTAILALLALVAAPVSAQMPYPAVEVVTSEGRAVIELDRPKAPITVDNFLKYVASGHYDGTIIHRVIPDFVVQGGGYDVDFKARPTRGEIVNESGNGLSNEKGTIAMARQDNPHTATSQWYVNLNDNKALDPNRRRWGYTVFGRVVEGMEVFEKIAAIETGAAGPLPAEVPQKPVLVHSMRVIEYEATQ